MSCTIHGGLGSPDPMTMGAEVPFTHRWVADLDDASGVEGEWYSSTSPTPVWSRTRVVSNH